MFSERIDPRNGIVYFVSGVDSFIIYFALVFEVTEAMSHRTVGEQGKDSEAPRYKQTATEVGKIRCVYVCRYVRTYMYVHT